jgi:hypothetical protein
MSNYRQYKTIDSLIDWHTRGGHNKMTYIVLLILLVSAGQISAQKSNVVILDSKMRC